AYGYRGLPLIFFESEQKKIAINLLPETKLEEVNTGLALIPLSNPSNTSVQMLIRNIFIIDKDVSFIVYNSSLLKYDLKYNNMKMFVFKNESGDMLNFHITYFMNN